MQNYHLKIGLFPDLRDLANFKTRKGTFEPAKAAAVKEYVVNYIKQHFTDEITEFADLDGITDEGMVHKTSDCERVSEYFKKEKIDALFIINCNFGNEDACGKIAELMKVPVLLWAPQDKIEPDGMRYTDSQCGLFAISKQLTRRGIPFSYIENCPVESPVFKRGFEKFLSVATIVKNFSHFTSVQIGARLNAFKSVMANELELYEKFGFDLQTVNLTEFTQKYETILQSGSAKLISDAEDIKTRYNIGQLTDAELEKLVAFVYAYKEIADEKNASAMCTECWNVMNSAVGALPCLAMSILCDMGYVVACESDICGAITASLLQSASRGKIPPIFGEFTVRHPENKNAELLWHCGVFPYSQKAADSTAYLQNQKPCFRVKDGEYTIAKFQGSGGKYTLLGGKFKTVPGPETFGTYMWAEFKDWPALEKRLMYSPYIHHMVEMYGDYTEELEEFCRFIPELDFDRLED